MYVFIMLLDYDNSTTIALRPLFLSLCYTNHYEQTVHINDVQVWPSKEPLLQLSSINE